MINQQTPFGVHEHPRKCLETRYAVRAVAEAGAPSVTKPAETKKRSRNEPIGSVESMPGAVGAEESITQNPDGTRYSTMRLDSKNIPN
jgi:hypothetical protein